MENITVTGYGLPVTEEPDNITVIKYSCESKRRAYYASNYGQILSFDKSLSALSYKDDRRNKSSIKHCASEYRRLPFYKKFKFKERYVHRFVADVFCPGRSAIRNQVDHIDGNPRNNRADNLRWCDQTANMRYAREIRTGERIITNLQKSLFYVTQ